MTTAIEPDLGVILALVLSTGTTVVLEVTSDCDLLATWSAVRTKVSFVVTSVSFKTMTGTGVLVLEGRELVEVIKVELAMPPVEFAC